MTMEARPSPRALVPYQEPEPILTLPERIRRFLQPRTSPARVPALSSGNVGSVSFVNNDVALARPGGSATYRAMAATPWVFSAIGIRKDQVSSADWDILPYDNTKKHSVRLQQRIHDLFDQPSMKLDSFQSFAATVVDDLLTLDAGCLFGEESVLLADGTRQSISRIVNQRLAIEVMAFEAESGRLVPRHVTGWYRNPVGERRWLRVNHVHARDMGHHGKRSTWFTHDHQLLTESGWREVHQIGDLRVVTSERQPNARSREVFDGTMLGDASLEGRGNRRHLGISHSVVQDEWAALVSKSVGLSMTRSDVPARSGSAGQVRYRSTFGGWLEEQAKRWLSPKKVVPRDLRLTDLTLATWFMDDGHRAVTHDKNGYECEISYFNSHGFSVDDQQFLVDLLIRRGIQANLQAAGKYTRIYVTAKGTRQLFASIGRYVPPTMRKKVGPTAPPFDPEAWGECGDEPYLDRIEVAEGNPRGWSNPVPKWAYCIDVETDHNFVSSGLVAHNCVEKVRYPDRSIAELWPVRGEWISVDERWDGSDPEKPRYYFIPDGTIRARFNNEDMLYMIANPRANSAVGLSPMAVLQTVIDSELQAMEYNRRMVMGAPPDGVLNIGDDAPKEKVDETSSFFNSKIFGQSSMAVIGGFKNPGYIPFNKSQREMQFREWQDLLIRCIAVTLKMSPQDLGITFDVNRSTSETQSQNTEDRGLRPLMSLIQKYFTREIVWDESFGGKDNNLQFVFKSLNLNETLQKANINRVAMPGVPWKSPNEARVTDGRPPIGDPEDEENIFNHLLTNTPKGMLDLTADKYVGEEQLAKIAADAQVSVAEAQGAIDATKADKAAQNAKEVAVVTPAPVVAAKPATKGLVFDEPAPPPVSIILPETYDVTVQHPFDPSELITAIKDIRITVPVVPAPVVNVPAPIVNLPAPIVTVTSDMGPVVQAIRDGFAVTTEREVTQTDAQGRPTEIVMRRGTATVRQTIKRDKTGRVTKTKDVTEVDGGA